MPTQNHFFPEIVTSEQIDSEMTVWNCFTHFLIIPIFEHLWAIQHASSQNKKQKNQKKQKLKFTNLET